MRILFDPFSSEYKSPFGTLVPGEACAITIGIPESCKTKKVKLVLLSEDGGEYASYTMKLVKREGEKRNLLKMIR